MINKKIIYERPALIMINAGHGQLLPQDVCNLGSNNFVVSVCQEGQTVGKGICNTGGNVKPWY